MNKKIEPKKRKRKKFFPYLSIFLFFVTMVTLGVLFFLNVIPFKYFIILVIGFIAFDILMFAFLLSRGWKRRLFGTIFSFGKIIAMFVILYYSFQTMDFFSKIKDGNYNTQNYSVLVLNISRYEKLKDLKDKTIGIAKLGSDEGLTLAEEHLKKTKCVYKEADDLDVLLRLLSSKQVDAILVEDSKKSIMEEEHGESLQDLKVIYQFSVDVPIRDNLVKNVDITSTPFTIFISGIDSYGKISSVSRSDVNMLMTINPVTNKILITSIPRDYYVKLNGINTNYKDKLTHAGIHGIDTSVKTVEDLLDVDINYYVKVNFTSLVTLVDKLGGIDVELDVPFRAYYNENGEQINYSFKKGTNHLNGKQALAFARERKSLALGDVARVEHQQLVLEGLFNKVLSANIVTKYTDVLNALEGKFVTNMGTQNITNLVKYQIDENPSWSLEKYTLKGTNGYQYTYSYKSKKTYVMEPDLDSVVEAKALLKSVLLTKSN